MMTHLERVQKFNPDYLLKEGYKHYMVKDGDKVQIHKSTFDAIRSEFDVKEQ